MWGAASRLREEWKAMITINEEEMQADRRTNSSARAKSMQAFVFFQEFTERMKNTISFSASKNSTCDSMLLACFNCRQEIHDPKINSRCDTWWNDEKLERTNIILIDQFFVSSSVSSYAIFDGRTSTLITDMKENEGSQLTKGARPKYLF